jgi:intracellular multiplication protein IcmE
MDPGLRRNLIIIGVAAAAGILGLIVIVASRMNSGSSAAAQVPTNVSVPNAAPAGAPNSEPTSPVMQSLLREQQLVEAEAARKAGRSYIPPDSAATEPLPAPSPRLESRLGSVPSDGGGVAVGPGGSTVLTAEEQARRDRIRRGLEVQIKDMMTAAAPPRQISRVQMEGPQPSASPAALAAQAPAAVAGGALAGPGPVAARTPSATLVDALEIFPATTMTPVDTYQTGYISARITAGRLAGAFLVGRTQMVNEGLQPRFTQMRWGGKTYAIDAMALDEKSGTDAVQANLDRRYMQRYVMPVVVAMLGGYSAAKAQTGTTTTAVGDIPGLTQPAPTETQALNAGVAQAMSMTQRVVDREATLPIRASLPAGTSIGIMFNAPVADVDSTREAAQDAAKASNAARRESMPAVPVNRVDAPVRTQGVPGGFQSTPGFAGAYPTAPAVTVPGTRGSAVPAPTE